VVQVGTIHFKPVVALMDSKLQLISKYGDGSDFYFIIKLKRILKKKASTPSTQTLLGNTTDARIF
jgi:hypothetical protein